MLYSILKWLFILVMAIFIIGASFTIYCEHSDQEAIFLAGSFPNPAPDGFYVGKVGFRPANFFWLGKKFDSYDQTGVNEFTAPGDMMNEAFPFKTYAGKGVRDPHLDVLKIDYDTRDNPFWMHPVLDEIVETSPDHYLGKLQVRLMPGYPFTLAFFELSK